MLKITKMFGTNAHTRLMLEGKLLQPWIDELLSTCTVNGRLILGIELDLAGVSFIDEPSWIVLRDLIRQGAAVAGTSPFVTELLKEVRTS